MRILYWKRVNSFANSLILTSMDSKNHAELDLLGLTGHTGKPSSLDVYSCVETVLREDPLQPSVKATRALDGLALMAISDILQGRARSK